MCSHIRHSQHFMSRKSKSEVKTNQWTKPLMCILGHGDPEPGLRSSGLGAWTHQSLNHTFSPYKSSFIKVRMTYHKWYIFKMDNLMSVDTYIHLLKPLPRLRRWIHSSLLVVPPSCCPLLLLEHDRLHAVLTASPSVHMQIGPELPDLQYIPEWSLASGLLTSTTSWPDTKAPAQNALLITGLWSQWTWTAVCATGFIPSSTGGFLKARLMVISFLLCWRRLA